MHCTQQRVVEFHCKELRASADRISGGTGVTANIAEANYNVATAFHALGRQQEAKRSVLNALEAAPRYEKAQELLLRIVGQ